MFICNKKYFLIIENIKDIQLSNIKLLNKYVIIYRNIEKKTKITELLKFRKKCKEKHIQFFVANDTKLMTHLKAEGLYISAFNKDLRLSRLKRLNFKIIGSAHSIKEIEIKKKQGCSEVIYSRLFKTNYKSKPDYLGVIRFNLLKLSRKEKLIPLGGIRYENLNKLNLIRSDSFVLMSEIKKKPAKIFSRLF